MKGMHGIIFSYEKKTELGTLTDQRIYGSVPYGSRSVRTPLSDL